MMGVYEIVYLFCGMFRAYTIYLLMTIFLKKRRGNVRTERMAYGTYYLVITVVYLTMDMPILNIVVNLVGLYLLALCYEGNLGKRLLTVFFIFTITIAVETGCVLVVDGMKYSLWETGNIDSILSLISTQIVTFMIAMLLRYRGRKREHILLSWQYWLSLIIIPFFTVYETVLLFSDANLKRRFAVFSMILALVVNFMVFYLYEQLEKAMRTGYEKKMMEMQNGLLEKQLEIMKASNEQIRCWKHDMNNHLTMLQSFVCEGQWSRAEAYMQEMLLSPGMRSERVRSGNVVIDSILNYKLMVAEEYGIQTEAEVQIPADTGLESVQWVTILGNLMDNAIEAAGRVKTDSYIKLWLFYAKERLIVVIRNAYNGCIRERNGQFYTTKHSDTGVHGLGLLNVRQALGELGEMDITYTENEFKVEIVYTIQRKDGEDSHGENGKDNTTVA